MIWSLIAGVITFVTSFLPNTDSGLITILNSIPTTLKNSLGVINYMFPVNTLFLIIGLMITAYLTKIGFKLVRYLINFIPFINAN